MSKLPETIVLVHIQKTAGTTLRRILERRYPPESIYHCYLKTNQEARDGFAQLPAEAKHRVRCVLGHVYFGFGELVPSPVTYLTILRDPVERILSLYHYILRQPDHRLHAEMTAQHTTLEEFVSRDDEVEVNNMQTRMIAGYLGDGAVPPEMIAAAQANLENRFLLAGITERFDEFLMLINRELAWPREFFESKNVDPNRSHRTNLPDSVVDTINAHNQLDLDLYAFADRRLDEALERAGPAFRLQARLFGLANRTYYYTRTRYGRARGWAMQLRPRRT
jgi:hypothetical protein